ncbi:MAG: hypothetical protein ACYS8W_19940 [Planctomycetota bacterium]|jgi:hypothetical protein
MFRGILITFFVLFALMVFSAPAIGDEGGENHEDGFALYRLVKPLGIATLGLLLVTALIGVGMWIKPNIRLKVIMVHRITGILAALSGLSHGIIVFILH